MNMARLRELLHQPEGLKLDFKREFYKIDSADQNGRARQWDELIKDILALTNSNVGVAHQPAYLIIGADDALQTETMRVVGANDLVQGTVPRTLYDVGTAPVTRSRLLAKVNEACTPPLPDLSCDLVDIDNRRLFVITIPPSPHLHQTTRSLTVPKTVYRENTVLVRRGEETFPATTSEIQAIIRDKQRIFEAPLPTFPPPQHTAPPPAPKQATSTHSSTLPPQLLASLGARLKPRRFAADTSPKLVFWVLVVVLAIWGVADSGDLHPIAGAIVGAAAGTIAGTCFWAVLHIMLWIIKRQPTQRVALSVGLWLPTTLGTIFGVMASPRSFADRITGGPAGVTLGLGAGIVVVLVLSVWHWITRYLRNKG